jgi:Leucine-rich repeat (LRR) protein
VVRGEKIYAEYVDPRLFLSITDLKIRDISEIEGLEYLTDLTNLNLSFNEIAEIKL